MTISGPKQRTTEVLIAEIGVDMTTFPTPKHLASWAGVCPDQTESGSNRSFGKTRKGSNWLQPTFTESALVATKTKTPTRPPNSNGYELAAASSRP
jgi:transposase